MSQITINGVSLDPAARNLAHASLLAADASSSNYLLIQVKAPLSGAQKAHLAQLGVELLEHVPENTYICRYNGSDLGQIRSLPFVAWANPYLKGFKIARLSMRPRTTPARICSTCTKRRRQPEVGIAGRRYRPASRCRCGRQSRPRSAPPQASIPAYLKLARGKFRIRVQPERLAAIAAIDEVRHLEPVEDKQLWNNVARRLLGADRVQAAAHLEGAGQIVAVADTGFDKGIHTICHRRSPAAFLKLYALGRPTASDPDGHGTHVCGSVLGDGVSTVYGPIRGTAPRAKLIMQSVLDSQGGLGGLPDDLHQLLQPAYADGARVHSNSWGDNNNGYSQDSHDIDAFVWNHRDLVVVFAAGNAGTDDDEDGVIDPHSVGSPGTARNCITVGASENDRPDFVYVDGNTRSSPMARAGRRTFQSRRSVTTSSPMVPPAWRPSARVVQRRMDASSRTWWRRGRESCRRARGRQKSGPAGGCRTTPTTSSKGAPAWRPRW